MSSIFSILWRNIIETFKDKLRIDFGDEFEGNI